MRMRFILPPLLVMAAFFAATPPIPAADADEVDAKEADPGPLEVMTDVRVGDWVLYWHGTGFVRHTVTGVERDGDDTVVRVRAVPYDDKGDPCKPGTVDAGLAREFTVSRQALRRFMPEFNPDLRERLREVEYRRSGHTEVIAGRTVEVTLVNLVGPRMLPVAAPVDIDQLLAPGPEEKRTRYEIGFSAAIPVTGVVSSLSVNADGVAPRLDAVAFGRE